MAFYLDLVTGRPARQTPVTTSAGAADAAKIIQTNAAGQVDITLLPSGIGPDSVTVLTSAALTAGMQVNIFNNAGTANVRPAIATSLSTEYHGYVTAAFASGVQATVFFDDNNTAVTALTPGVQYLSATTAGGVSITPPSTAGQIVQRVGVATSATSLHQAGFPESYTL
jgi:hypothetical protein